jgi:hypothetical protein
MINYLIVVFLILYLYIVLKMNLMFVRAFLLFIFDMEDHF